MAGGMSGTLTETHMAYSRATLLADLQALGIASWDWAGSKPGRVNPALVKDDPTLAWGGLEGSQVTEKELPEYCWRAYEKARTSAGDLVIGRESDLTAAGLYEKVAGLDDGDTILDRSAAGNLLKLDKWARVVNDSWVIGGIHRQAKFRLASSRIPKNLWNAEKSCLIVTARELLGLLHFGYALEQVGPWQVLLCRNASRAAGATLVEYDKLIKRNGTVADATKFLQQATPGAVVPGTTPSPLVAPPGLR